MKTWGTIITSLLLISSFQCLSEPTNEVLPATREISPASKTITNSQGENPEIKNEIELLKKRIELQEAENKILKEYHSHLLSTVYWSLSCLGGISLILVGFGWWSNSTIHQKDLAVITSGTKEIISEFELKFNQDMQSKIDRLSSLIDDRKTQTSEEIKKIIYNIESNSNNIKTIRLDLKKQYNEQILNLRLVEEKVWDIKGVYSNVLLTQVQILNSAIAVEVPYVISSTLSRMIEVLAKFVSNKTQPSEFAMKSLRETLMLVPENNSIEVSNILELISAITNTDHIE
ncbi:hypothetical protein [Plesiomonas shigelloides]|uniref:hypothetical protein n=1 Tax=Plesiomonas shigelloides TaxID=703 RepID=UPI0021187B08|nr:hypothetical protein [Plesiomonas shigelloides]MCQ8860090.1 hypothetical protein [Plesiomonas shigelloides]